MGGIGSGQRWHYDKKNTVNDFLSIDIRDWHHDGSLISYQSFEYEWLYGEKVVSCIEVNIKPCLVTLEYQYQNSQGKWIDECYPVEIEWTPCNFGGERPWFICPAIGCGRRVAILYDSEIFACRHCLQLAYTSQRETYGDRAARRANKIRERLGWEPGILKPKRWKKPKGMHKRTFGNLTREYDDLVAMYLGGISMQINSLTSSLKK